jgi:hypothetical protein
MGTTTSSGQAATTDGLKVVLDNPIVIPGSQVTGRVCFTVQSEKIDVDNVMVSLTAVEIFKNGPDWVDHNYPFLEAIPVTVAGNGSFARGQYEFRFAFTIPPNGEMFPSMRCDGVERGSCSIIYFIKAKVQTARTAEVRFFKSDFEHSAEVIVLGFPPMTPRSLICATPVEYPLNDTFGCCGKPGNIRFGFLVSSNILAAGEQFEVAYAIQNNSSIRLDQGKDKGMEFQLIEEVRFGGAVIATNLFSRRFERGQVLIDHSRSVEPNDSVSARAGNATISHPQILQQLQAIMSSGQYRICFQVPATACPTMDSRFIHVTHYLKMTVLTPVKHELKIQLTIHSPAPPPSPASAPLLMVPSMGQQPVYQQQPSISAGNWQQQQHPPPQMAPMQQRALSTNSSGLLPLNNNNNSEPSPSAMNRVPSSQLSRAASSGKSASTTNALQVVLDNPAVFPGSQVTGKVVLTVHSGKMDVEKVMVSFVAEEYFEAINGIQTAGEGGGFDFRHIHFLQEVFQ